MGVYDSIVWACPICKKGDVEAQCGVTGNHSQHYSSNLPKEIADALSGETVSCRQCGARFEIVIKVAYTGHLLNL